MLRIRLFGAVDLRYGDDPLPPLESARAESLLAYLLLHRDAPQPRQHLAYLLWPDSAESQARTNLRHLLHTLRRALPEPDRFLETTPRTLRWRPDAPLWLDVAAFVEAIGRAGRDPDGGLAALREAVALYTGDLLDGCYDEWLIGERGRLREVYLDVLGRLIAAVESLGEYGEAIGYADQLLRHDPLSEETYRLLMRLHDARGDRARALHVYHVCVATLERELGVEPSPATQAAYEAVLPAHRQPEDQAGGGGRLGGPPLVGRSAEWTRLTASWRAAEAGRAHLVAIIGEPGIGKTRLVEELDSWTAHGGAVTAVARSYAAEGALAYGLLVAWLRAEGIRARLGRLEPAHLTELARLLPELLAELPDLPRPEPLSADDQRQRLFAAAASAVRRTGAPLLLVADDLQWADRESLQFLHYLIRSDPRARLLVAATARREEIGRRHAAREVLGGLQLLDRCTEIQLERLSKAETAVLAERLSGRPLVQPDVDRLYDETEGSPLFVVEALRAGWQRGSTERGRLSPKVQTAIESRLAQLSEPARDLVGLAATVGRAFTTDVLIAASADDGETVVRALDELWRRQLVREQGANAYDFSHDKIREVAYLGLGPAIRRHAHLRVGRALERLHGQDCDAVSAQLAMHFEHAGLIDEAVSWYTRAAEAAQRLHANVETIRLLDRALGLLRTLPPTQVRRTQELALLTALLAPLGAAEGWASESLAAAERRALELARALGEEPAPPVLRSMAIASLSRREFAAARALGERLYRRAERDTDEMLLVEANYLRGIAAFWQGEFRDARRHFTAAVEHYLPDQRQAHLLRYGLDPKVVCLSRLANTLWFLGYPASAIGARDAALALADELDHPFSRAVALVFAAVLALDMRDTDALRVYAATLADEQAQHDTLPNRVATEYFGGYLDVLDGRRDAGIARLQRALDEARQADHAPGMRANSVRVLIEACAAAGDARTGLAVTDWALGLSDAHAVWEAETRRLRADFLAGLGDPADEVDAELERALAVARRQQARAFELRTATSLLRHRLGRGDASRAREAQDLLTSVLATLPERRESLDLRDATALLSRC